MIERLSPTPSLRCPTCGASQTESPVCRRCKCDLSLVVAARRQARDLHRECLQAIQRQDLDRAAMLAQRRYALTADETSHRLLAVAHLLQGNFAQARRVAEKFDSQ